MSTNHFEVTMVSHKIQRDKMICSVLYSSERKLSSACWLQSKLYPVTVQGLYFAPACDMPLPMTVLLCTTSNGGAAGTIVQAQVYLGPPVYTTISDSYDDSPSPSNDEYEVKEGGLLLNVPIVTLPSYIGTCTVCEFTIDQTQIQLCNSIDLFFVEKQHHEGLLVNSVLQANITSMWPVAQCTFKGGLLVAM